MNRRSTGQFAQCLAVAFTAFSVVVATAALLAVGGCGRKSPTPDSPAIDASAAETSPGTGRLKVVATYSVLADWVRELGGDDIELTVLVGPGGDAHTYEPTPSDAAALAQAQLIFENGLGFEAWLDRLCVSSGTRARRVVTTQPLKPRKIEVSPGVIEVDPHVWHSPTNAQAIVRSIAAALAEADPSREAVYRSRSEAYSEQLGELDRWIRMETAKIPAARRRLVTTHDTFGYFAADYGFEVENILGSTSSETADPSAAHVAAVIERIRRMGVPAVFAENILNPQLTEQVASAAGVSVVRTLHTDALGPADSPASTYLGMMRSNVRTIRESLQ